MLASGELGRLASTTRTAGSLSKLTDRLAKCSPCEQPTHVITDDVRRLQRLLQLQCHACRLTSSLQLTQPGAPRCPLIDGLSILTRYQRRVCFVSLASHLPLSCAGGPGRAPREREGAVTGQRVSSPISVVSKLDRTSNGRARLVDRRLTDRRAERSAAGPPHTASRKSLVEPGLRVRPTR